MFYILGQKVAIFRPVCKTTSTNLSVKFNTKLWENSLKEKLIIAVTWWG